MVENYSQCSAFLDTTFRLGECPIMDGDGGVFYWADIMGHAIHSIDWKTRLQRKHIFGTTVGSFGLTTDSRLIVALRSHIILYDPSTGRREQLAMIEAGDPRTRLNDGKVGPDGAFWVGTMDDFSPRRPIGALYRVDRHGHVKCMASGIGVSNSLAWSIDGRQMYHADTSKGQVDLWDFDPQSGAALNRRAWLRLTQEQGRPDGAALDRKGNYWLAGVTAGKLLCFSPEGTLLHSINMPVSHPTMPCFAGPDYDQMLVTSLKEGLDSATLENYPLSGGLIAVEVEAAGLPSHRFQL